MTHMEEQSMLQQLFGEGVELLKAGKAADALARFQTACSIDRHNATLGLYCGVALHSLGRYEEAVDSYRHALTCAPDMGQIYNNLGNSLLALQRFNDAVDCFSRASMLLPLSPVPLAARATALLAIGNVAEGEADCRKALQLDPSFAAAHWNLALHLLLQGNYREGWQEYEWRWLKPDFTSPRRHPDLPLWDGSDLGGQPILLHAEQGFGDAIQFVRYASMVAQRGGNVILECHPQLVQIMQTVEGVSSVIPFKAKHPAVNCHAPLLSLPRIFGTTLQSVPSRHSYLSVPVEQRNKWLKVLPFPHPSAIRIGLVWAGKSYPDPLRSSRLEDFAPLSSLTGVQFYSLQVGPGSEQADSPPAGMHLIDHTDQFLDFADTAAVIEQLDLVISIDTAVAHLAAALGRPVFLMLPFVPDWRWLLERSDSPWYPAMRIFRQTQPGDWADVVLRIRSVLSSSLAEQ